MSKQTIGIGTVANDGTGDALRTAFTKVNANDTELYGRMNTSTADPGVSDDNTAGWVVGAVWTNTNTGKSFVARSVATGAAVWIAVNSQNLPNYIANNWYLPDGVSGIGGGANPGSGSIRFVPGLLRERVTISALGGRCSTLFGGGNIQFAIYANNASTGKPTGNALASTGSVTLGATGSINGAVSVQLEAGLYWFASNMDNATAVMVGFNGLAASPAAILGDATQANTLVATATLVGTTLTQTFGTWPDVTSSGGSMVPSVANTVPAIQFKVGSVP